MDSDAAESTPSPMSASMQLVIEVVATIQVPVRTNLEPFHTIPAFLNAQTMPVSTDTAKATPEPATCTVVVILLAHFPELADDAPLALDVTPDDTQAVLVHTNAPVRTPSATNASVQDMVVMEALGALPELASNLPAATILLFENSLTIAMTANSLVRAPRPAWLTEVMIILPHLPELVLDSPMALHIVLDNTMPIVMQTDTFV